ncbi:MAG: hypothetical protein K2N05_12830 [Muribaculaceae bacterium]|nr:hypothetical protein [Muribaculaceae bacterium]
MAKRFFTIITTIIIIFQGHSKTIMAPDLVWEYYDFYTPGYTYDRVILERYNLANDSPGEEGDFIWKNVSNREWIRYRSNGGYWEYNGEPQLSYPAPKIKEEDGKVWIIITPEYAKIHGLYEYVISNDTYKRKEVELKEDLPVILYDFEAKVGDRYPTIILGNLLTTANVVETSFRDDILDGVKQVRILTDFTMQYFDIKWEPDSEWLDELNHFTVGYVEKIGNITSGTFTDLNPYYDDNTGLKEYAVYINNIYDSEGNIVYKGRNFDGEASIYDLSIDSIDKNDSLLYDLHGRVVTNPQPGSIYIRGGKKFVAK